MQEIFQDDAADSRQLGLLRAHPADSEQQQQDTKRRVGSKDGGVRLTHVDMRARLSALW